MSFRKEMAPLKVALIGFGNIGTGVARILLEERERIAHRAGREIQLCAIVDADIARPRDVTLPERLLTNDLGAVLEDDSITAAVQLIGGLEPACSIMLKLLESGKDIVTANKALLCERGDVVFSQARELGRCVAFEAAVAGGIPIIRTLGQGMTANQITSIDAILNGTSNFILTNMLARNQAYSDILRDAQESGYAEADPAMDVDGTDAAQKLVILAQMAFGTHVPLSAFPRQGIDTLELADLHYANELGYTVKLLAAACLVNGQLEMHVQPTLVRHDRPLAKVDGPFNMIALKGDVVGRTWYSGPGAGRFPTASAVVADVIDLAIGRAQQTFNRLDLWQEHTPVPVQPAEEISCRCYLRLNVEDRPHVLADIADVLGRHGISIASVIQHEAPESGENGRAEHIVPLVIMTHRSTEGNLRAASQELARLSALRPPSIRMPVAD